MYMTGFADEAADTIEGQIEATRALGWKWIESRGIMKKNIHDIPEAEFEHVCAALSQSGVGINCFGSAIANWGKKIEDPFTITLEEIQRAIPRMQKLGTRLIRIMSYAVRDGDDQMEEERFRRVREIKKRFDDAGITVVHENCMNYGGMSWCHTLKLVDNVPGLRLVFDTGNPLFSADRSKPQPYPRQSAWEFYSHVREHVSYIHIKDGRWDAQKNEAIYSYCGEGDGDVRRIIEDLIKRGYDGGISIEPHLAVVFHDATKQSPEKIRFDQYVEYGRRMEKIVRDLGGRLA